MLIGKPFSTGLNEFWELKTMDWKNVVGKVAPVLGAALGGPLGGAAVSAIADALGLSEKTEEAVKNALSGTTPEQLLALKKADQDFAVRMEELGLKKEELGFTNEKDQLQIAAGDRDSARKREMAVGDHTARNLAYAITIGFFSVLFTLMFAEVDTGAKEILYVMLGSLGTAWTSVMAYYFGSTAGSKLKTELLSKAEPIK
jgi:hypothetical protein